jgi:hypothetical protein
MEIVKISISKELFEKLFTEGHIKSGEYELIEVTEPNFDYGMDEKWTEAKSASIKAYKKLKEIEFNLRHNKS